VNRFILAACVLVGLGGGLAVAQTAESERAALLLATRQAEEARRRSEQLERQAAAATDEAARARARAILTAERIQAAEAEITAAETRIRMIENQRAAQRARLAERQEPVARLAAALQTMARRPPALALVQPGSLEEVVHVRSLLASTLPIIRRRTASLRHEIEAANRLRDQAERAVASLVAGQQELKKQRVALARIEAEQRRRSQSLAGAALFESDRALAFSEEAFEVGQRVGTYRQQAQVRRRLTELPGPLLRPTPAGGQPEPPDRPGTYLLPVDGRLVVGTGEVSDAGIHARGLTFEARSYSAVVAPSSGRIIYAGPFRGFGDIVIIDHGRGLTTLITNLGDLGVKVGDVVQRGQGIGRTGRGRPRVMVELRQGGMPISISPLVAAS
jgi:septal ring factor EnvC (AmiA/AmiB activator)